MYEHGYAHLFILPAMIELDELLRHVRFCPDCWAKVRRATKRNKRNEPPMTNSSSMEAGIVCDASCIDGYGTLQRDGYFHGRCEWQAIDLSTGEKVVVSSVQRQSTINIAETCAIIDSLRYLNDKGDETTPVYSDSKYGIGWVTKRRTNSALPRNEHTADALFDLDERMRWLIAYNPKNPVIWYNERAMGKNPADFNRK